jgi:hypothetical protein
MMRRFILALAAIWFVVLSSAPAALAACESPGGTRHSVDLPVPPQLSPAVIDADGARVDVPPTSRLPGRTSSARISAVQPQSALRPNEHEPVCNALVVQRRARLRLVSCRLDAGDPPSA